VIEVHADQNVLAAALAAGLPLRHGCRAGRCASCKSTLVSGQVEYPAGIPPGITAGEIARGEVLLCQALPRSDLVVETRRTAVRSSPGTMAQMVAKDVASLGALRLRFSFVDATLDLRPGQFVEVRNHAGDAERLPVVRVDARDFDVESPDDGSPLHRWLADAAQPGSQLRISGPYMSPR
jgi:CDP-4-dehydro-6-deoxyglucose reductase